jgi:hypothetical protein
VHHFITDNKANVVGLVMAGSADFKTELQMSDLFDPRLLVRFFPFFWGGEGGCVVSWSGGWCVFFLVWGEGVYVWMGVCCTTRMVNHSPPLKSHANIQNPLLPPPPPPIMRICERRKW